MYKFEKEKSLTLIKSFMQILLNLDVYIIVFIIFLLHKSK